ncbi:hypothetical protein BCR32DRAFT_300701 [Anaeromyces robustus]|uniref:Uncharacterized protein n=1 Tax=Anaeromyces robustus TaxID=1754192 RepID=A0A1Y1X1H8_9FUNG|nr:hypothetical protein BCR32DRAFT_300701 [Anaeromyces robustus]|eukprot:ORX79657.1 hypothetical protein BCR32DRAFT_300701 [Anaeromyces robustus]
MKKELIEIKVQNEIKLNVNEIDNSFKGKNIFLFKVKLNLYNVEVQFKIKLNYFNENCITKDSYTIQKYQQLFIFMETYEYKNWNFKRKEINDLNDRCKISYFQKFEIYKSYLIQNNMTDLISILLEDSIKTILKPKTLNFEYILVYLMNLINNQTNYSELPYAKKEIFKLIILNIERKKKVNIKNYNNNEAYTKIINIIENFKIKSDEDFFLPLQYFLLIFYHLNDQEKFKYIFQRIPQKKEVIKYIQKHKKIFSKLQAFNLQIIFENTNINKDFNFNDILNLASDYNEYIKFFCLNGDYILAEKPKIKFSEYPKPDENTEIDLLVQYIEILMEMSLDKKDLNYLKNQFSYLIDKLKMKDYYKLKALKEIHNKYNKNIMVNHIFSELDEVLHCTGKYFIENNRLNNLEIITFIQMDALKYYKCYENNYEFAYLIKYIDLDKVDEKFCNTFNRHKYDYEKLFKNHYAFFLDSITQNATKFSHLPILYHIFNIYNKPLSVKRIIDQLVETLIKNNLNKENKDIIELTQMISPLFKLISDNNNHGLNDLIRGIKKKFSEKEVNKIFIIILNNFSNQLNHAFIEKLIKNINNLTNDEFILYLNQLTNKKMQAHFLQKISNRFVSENEIFNQELSENVKLLFELIPMGYFKYYNKSKKIKKNKRNNKNNKKYKYEKNGSKKKDIAENENKDGKDDRDERDERDDKKDKKDKNDKNNKNERDDKDDKDNNDENEIRNKGKEKEEEEEEEEEESEYESEDENIFKNVKYIMNTVEVMSNIIKKLTNFDFSMELTKIIYHLNKDNNVKNRNNFKSRLYLISLGKRNYSNNLYNVVIRKVN